RVAIDMLRARKRMVLWEAEDVEREVDAAATTTPLDAALAARRDREAARKKAEDALARIHPRYAAVIRARVLEERPREGVARERGVTPATFDVLLHRAIAALKKAIQETERERPEASHSRSGRAGDPRGDRRGRGAPRRAGRSAPGPRRGRIRPGRRAG